MKDFEIDTIGVHPPSEPRDYEIALIEDLLRRYGDSLIEYVLLKRRERKLREAAAVQLWPRFECPTLEAKMAFDCLLQKG